MSTLPVDAIQTDGGTQARAGLNETVLADYMEAMRGGAVFPPIVVFQDTEGCWLADGFHRTEAARRLQLSSISAEVREGGRQDAILFACGANQTHGLRRSRADKRAAARLAIATFPDWSGRKLAAAVGVSHTFIDSMRGGNVATDDDLELVTQAVELFKEALELQKEQLKDPTLPLSYWAEQKRIAEEALAHARSYTLYAERELGRRLLTADAARATLTAV